MNVAMKKKSLEDSLSGHTAQVEEERKIELLEGKKFETLYDYYEEALRVGQRSDYIPFPRLALTPKEINAFLRSTIKYEHLDEYNNYRGSMATGRFINSLIGQSYDAGHNDFILNCKSLPLISFLGSSLKADQERQLNLTVEGDVYTAFGNWIENCFFHLKGSAASDCARDVKSSRFHIDGNVGLFHFDDLVLSGMCGEDSEDSSFYVGGGCGFPTGAKNLELEFGGDIGGRRMHGYEPNINSVFKTSNKKTLVKLKRRVRETDKKGNPTGNKIIFTDSSGTEKVVRDYS